MLTYKIKINKENVVDNIIDIPLGQLFYPNSEQYYLLEDKFETYSNNIINPIIDYEKIKLYPVTTGSTYTDINSIQFNLKFYLNGNWTADTTSLDQAGFDDDDILNKRKQLKKTFIRLSFYDSDNLKTQNLLFYSTIFIDSNKLYSEYITGSTISELKTEFKVNNPKISSEIKSFEGFYVYLFNDDIPKNEIKTIYMKVEYNSALNGKTLLFLKDYSHDTTEGFSLENLKVNMFLPISVKYETSLDKYVYWFNEYNEQNAVIDLFQAKVI